MQLFRVVRPLIGFVLPLCSLPVFAQGPAPRLGKGITDRARVVLSESRTPRVRSAQDLGPVSPDMGVPGITLVFRRSATQQVALEDLLAAQQDPASSLYHRWLTPETFAARFGVAEEDIATAESWLMSHGFHIDKVARSRDRITFSGTAAQVQAAFGAELHHYRAEGELHFAPASDLTLPAELASVTAAVLHLSDFRPKPSVKVMAGTHPDYTSSSTQAHYLTPNDVRTMYGVSSNNYTYGNGQSLAVVGQSFVSTSMPSSVYTFQQLTQYNPISPVLVPGSGVEAISPGDESESELDLEYASGIAQSANIFLVYVGANQNYSVFDALTFAITERIAPVISISYGVCEPMLSPSELDQYNAVFQEASAQGQTLVASSGDTGSTACAPYSAAQGITPAEQQELSVDFPASSPNVTAVGGTQMAPGTFTAGNSPYWLTASSADSPNSLRSYVPEVVWNEGSPSHGIVSGGGGSSVHFPRPAWQSAYPGIPTGTNRLLPDIALQSSITSPGFILCTSDPAMLNAEGQTSSCVDGLLGSNNKFTIAGGTSFAAPIFAGFVALLNQAESANGQGNINPELYSLAKSSSAVFHDITSGTNACAAGATNCGSAGESSYVATAGYDEATGLGSIDATALMTAWPSSNTAGLEHTSIRFSPSNSGIPILSGPIRIFVGADTPSSSNLPTGGVSVSVDGTVSASNLPFTVTYPGSDQASVDYYFNDPAASGSHLITVTYPGDATHAPSIGVESVVVGSVMASGGVTLSAANLTIANGNTGSTKVTVTPTGGYNGRMMWSLSATVAAGNAGNLTACYAIPSLPVSGISTANLTIGIGTACQSAAPATGAAFRTLSQRALPNGKTRAHWSGTTTTGVYACALICGCLVGSRRKWRQSLTVVTVLLLPFATANMSGCGGGSKSTGQPPTTPTATTYTVTLSGTDSVNTAITASTTFTLTVD
jgi:hypothetical protein